MLRVARGAGITEKNNNLSIHYKLHNIEAGILKKANIFDKSPQHKIYEQLKNGNIKIFSDNIDKINNCFLKTTSILACYSWSVIKLVSLSLRAFPNTVMDALIVQQMQQIDITYSN